MNLNVQGCRILIVGGGRLARTVLYDMAATCLKEIANELLREGLDPATPAAVVERAGLPGECSRTTTLGELQDQPADSPATVMIGDVVGLCGASSPEPPCHPATPAR